MNKATVATIAAIGVGFAVGFFWGRGSNTALSDNVKTSVYGGKMTVEVDIANTAKEGFLNILNEWG